jgi:hypothetical protein
MEQAWRLPLMILTTAALLALARPFAVATTAVTWDQWEACVRDRWRDGIAIDTALRLGQNGEPNPEYRDNDAYRFMSNPYMQRSARRGAPYPATQRGRDYLGFRVAKTLPGAP